MKHQETLNVEVYFIWLYPSSSLCNREKVTPPERLGREQISLKVCFLFPQIMERIWISYFDQIPTKLKQEEELNPKGLCSSSCCCKSQHAQSWVTWASSGSSLGFTSVMVEFSLKLVTRDLFSTNKVILSFYLRINQGRRLICCWNPVKYQI